MSSEAKTIFEFQVEVLSKALCSASVENETGVDSKRNNAEYSASKERSKGYGSFKFTEGKLKRFDSADWSMELNKKNSHLSE